VLPCQIREVLLQCQPREITERHIAKSRIEIFRDDTSIRVLRTARKQWKVSRHIGAGHEIAKAHGRTGQNQALMNEALICFQPVIECFANYGTEIVHSSRVD
jgi:hypothetical protein